MASNVNPLNINGAYPIAGQDNDSQGFRDNFTNIRTNLTFAKAEIEDLQSKVVLKSPLDGQAATENNFNGTILVGAQVTAFTETTNLHGLKSGAVVVDYATGSLHQIQTNGPISNLSMTWTGLDTGLYAKMRVVIDITNVSHTVVFSGAATLTGANKIAGLDTATKTLTAPLAGVYMLELSTFDAGNTVYIVPVIVP